MFVTALCSICYLDILLHMKYSLQVVLLDLKSSILREVSACPRDPKAVLFRLAQFLFEALVIRVVVHTLH